MIRPAAAALACLLLSAGAASAQSDAGVAIGVNAGTPGLGFDAQIRLGQIFVLRGGIESLEHDFDETYEDVNYTGRLQFDTVSGFVDVHPLANGFLISGGAYVGDRSIGLDGRPDAPVEIGGATFTPAQVGTLTGEIKLKDVAPFVGLGFDDTFTRSGRWGFRAIAGVAWSEAPEVALSSSGGTLSNDPAFRARLAAEARQIEADAEDYGLFPVLQLGLNYRF